MRKNKKGKEIIMEIYEIIAVCMLAGAMIMLGVRMVIDKEFSVQKWLVGAVAQAERLIGSGNGQKKLKRVYEMFNARFPAFSVFVSLDTFSRWVDIALDIAGDILSAEKEDSNGK